MGYLEVSWGILGYLGVSWGIFGHLWPSWGILGHLGVSWGILGYLGVSWGVLGYLGPSWGGTLLGWGGSRARRFLEYQGFGFLVVSWGLGPSWGILGCLGPSWGISGYLGVSWGILGHLGVSWGILGHLGVSWGILGHLGVSWGIEGGRCRNQIANVAYGYMSRLRLPGWSPATHITVFVQFSFRIVFGTCSTVSRNRPKIWNRIPHSLQVSYSFRCRFCFACTAPFFSGFRVFQTLKSKR